MLIVRNALMSGKVIDVNCRHGVAPSMEAASYSSPGMVCSPER